MHVIPPSSSEISLFSRGGIVCVYPSLKHALKDLGYSWISHNVGTDFRVFSHVERFWGERPLGEPVSRVYHSYEYILRSDAGKPLTAADFNPFRTKRKKFSSGDAWNGEGPVPGVRKHRGGGYHYFRKVRTASERRMAQVLCAPDGEPAPRAKRSASNIPHSWDDIHTRQPVRSWKMHRKNQWKD